MILKTLSPDHPDIPAITRIYEESFPENERPMTMEEMLALSDQLPEQLSAEFLGIYTDEAPSDPAGFFLTVGTDFCTFLVYFAIAPNKRSGGIGGNALFGVSQGTARPLSSAQGGSRLDVDQRPGAGTRFLLTPMPADCPSRAMADGDEVTTRHPPVVNSAARITLATRMRYAETTRFSQRRDHAAATHRVG